MNIVFLVSFRFPYGDASSIRALNICHLLYDAGHTVHVISDYKSDEDNGIKFITYEAVSQFNTSIFNRYKIVNKSIKLLENYCAKNHVDAVLTNARFDRFHKVSDFCIKRRVKLYIESCEWYHYSSFKLGLLDFRYWKNQLMIKKGFKRANGFISISRLLDKHNSSLGIPSIRIPTIMDTEKILYDIERVPNKKINIIYTGNIGKSKEFLFPIIALLAEDDMLKNNFRYHIYGPSTEQVLRNIGNEVKLLEKASDSVVIHGKVPQTSISSILRDSDYLIFFRPNRLSSNAGFPTKLGESLAVGTPIITNDTGDISLYIKDGVNGFIVDDYELETIKRVLHRVLNISQEEYFNMRRMARKTAEDNFDYRKYIQTVKTLFN